MSQTNHHRQDGQYVLPTTPEQMEEIILARIAQVTSESARSRSPTSFYDARQNLGDDLNKDFNSFHRQSTPKEVPITFYRNTTTVSCDMLKANKLSENEHDNFKRKEMILKVLQTEVLLTTINKMRPPPTCSEENPTGYSPRRMIHDELGKHAVSADDQFQYAHDFARLYVVISIATSESLQFLFSEATTCGNGILLWESIISKLFGTTYRDAFDAAEKLRKWNIDPSKPLQHDIHILLLLVKRANKTAKTVLPEASILGMLHDASSKDPREELRMLGSNSSFIGQSLEEFIITLHKSTHTGPFNSRHVKMNKFKTKTKQYCNHFQEEKCRFGEKCRYEHKINPDYRRKEVDNDERKKSNNIIPSKNNNKLQYKKKISTPQNVNNDNSQYRNDNIEGKPPRNSTVARVWLESYVQFPHSYSYTDKKNTTFADHAFMNFLPTMTTYHLPDSGGSYLSRFQNDTSHIVLTIALEAITPYKSIYLTVILLDFMAYASHNISKIIHRLHKNVCDARHTFKKRIIKAANEYNLQFKYIKIFEAIVADVFVMPYINHHDDTILTYLATPDIIDTIGYNSVEYNRKTHKLSDMRARKVGIQNEYVENVDTPILQRYNKLNDVPKEPSDTFAARYALESRNHRYYESAYVSSNPIIINSWTADIARSTMFLSDSSDNHQSSYTSSNTSSSSSSKSSRHNRSSLQVVMRSPPQRRQPLYANAIKLNSPIHNEIPSSSATSSSSAPTISNNNNNINIPEQVG